MTIPSYDDLTPSIPDVPAADAVFQRARVSVCSPSALYACLYDGAGSAGRLSALARDFSPRVARAGEDSIVLDVSGLGALIGLPAAIGAELERAIRDAGLTARVAIAPTQTAARLLAIGGPSLSVTTTDPAGALAPLPIAVLRGIGIASLSVARSKRVSASAEREAERLFQTLDRWGIATLGDLAALPAADLSSRLGRTGLALQRLARGEDPGPFVPDADAPRYVERLELEWPIDGLEPLSFVLARLLDPLAAALERADRGAAAVRLDLRLVDRSAHARVLQLPTAMRDPRVLRTLLRLDLESHPPSAAIDIVAIEIDPAPGRITQFSLLERAVPSPETLSTLTARLSALVGETRCGSAALVDTYRPGAFEMRPFAPADEGDIRMDREAPLRKCGCLLYLRRCRMPFAIRVTVERGRPGYVAAGRRGAPSGAVTQAAGPWRSSGGWWGSVPPWNRDEWDAALTSGAICRIFRDRDTGRWFLDGVYD